MKKAIKWTLIIVPLLLILAVVVVLLTIDSIAKKQIPAQTTAQTNLPASLGDANISLFGGNVVLSNLDIGSPQGYAPEMFHLGKLDVKVSYRALLSNPIRIEEITIENPKLTIERQGANVNVYAAMQQLPKQTTSAPSGAKTPAEPMRLVVGKLTIANTQTVVRPNMPFGQKQYTLTLPSITLNNVGDQQNGATIKQVLDMVLDAMMKKVDEQQKIPPEVLAAMKSGDYKAAATQAVQKQLEKYQGKGQQELHKGLEGLLGGKKKK